MGFDAHPQLSNAAGGQLAPAQALLAFIDHAVEIPPELLPEILADPDCLYIAARRAGWLACKGGSYESPTRPPTAVEASYARAEAIAKRIAINLTGMII
jgi:hypothetical protein